MQFITAVRTFRDQHRIDVKFARVSPSMVTMGKLRNRGGGLLRLIEMSYRCAGLP